MHSHIIEPRSVSITPRNVAIARVARVLDYAFSVIYGLLLVRFALELLGARSQSGFVQLIRSLSDGLYAPFRGIFATADVSGGGHITWSLLVAVLGYMLLHALIRGLLRLLAGT